MRRGGGRGVRWWALVALVVGSGLIAWRTVSVSAALELVAVLGLLLGVGVAFGGMQRRSRPGSSLLPPGRPRVDEGLAAKAELTLASFDRIEHRRLEVGDPWPQLLVGPNGALVVDLCPVESQVELDRSGVRDRGTCDGEPCPRCVEALQLAATVRATLESERIALPVRTVAVVSPGTCVEVRADAPADVAVVPVDRLAEALAHGPVLPMATVEAAFAELAHAVVAERSFAR